MSSEFVATVRCIACQQARPATQLPCPHCQAKPYRHKTVDPQEFQEQQQEKMRRFALPNSASARGLEQSP